MRIRFIKDGFYGIKKGDVFEVEDNMIHSPFPETVKSGYKYCYFQLESIEGFYEEVVGMPREGEEFFFINAEGGIVKENFHLIYSKETMEHQGWFKTYEEAEAYRVYCAKYKEKK